VIYNRLEFSEQSDYFRRFFLVLKWIMGKDDKQLVTKNDLIEFGEKLSKNIGINLEQKFNYKITDLEKKMFVWKSEIFDLVDDLGMEIRDGREHRAITSHQITENTRRIEVLENNYTFVKQ